MKAEQIKVDGLYKAKVSGRVVTVKVDKIVVREGRRYSTRPDNFGMSVNRTIRGYTYYECTNTVTGRKISIMSAAKFRSEVSVENQKLEVETKKKVEAIRTVRNKFHALSEEQVKAIAESHGVPDMGVWDMVFKPLLRLDCFDDAMKVLDDVTRVAEARGSRGTWWTRRQFIDYLRNTLIPDLIESRHYNTADDFRMAVAYLEGPLVDTIEQFDSEADKRDGKL